MSFQIVVDNIWHLDLLVPCSHVHFTVGDRAIIESNSANQFSVGHFFCLLVL